MTCAGCPKPANADTARYGRRWCTDCVAMIEFEERLARENEMAVVDIDVKDGRLVFVLTGHDGRPEGALAIGLTYTDVLREIREAAARFRQNLVIAQDGIVVATSRHAVDSARQLLAVIKKYKPLLAPEERELTKHAQRLARLVVGQVH